MSVNFISRAMIAATLKSYEAQLAHYDDEERVPVKNTIDGKIIKSDSRRAPKKKKLLDFLDRNREMVLFLPKSPGSRPLKGKPLKAYGSPAKKVPAPAAIPSSAAAAAAPLNVPLPPPLPSTPPSSAASVNLLNSPPCLPPNFTISSLPTRPISPVLERAVSPLNLPPPAYASNSLVRARATTEIPAPALLPADYEIRIIHVMELYKSSISYLIALHRVSGAQETIQHNLEHAKYNLEHAVNQLSQPEQRILREIAVEVAIRLDEHIHRTAAPPQIRAVAANEQPANR